MTGRERIENTLAWKPTDRTPTMLHSFMAATKESGYTMEEYRSDPTKMAKTHIDMAKKYDLDGILIDMDTCLLSYAMGAKADFPQDSPGHPAGAVSDDIDQVIAAMDPSKVRANSRVQTLLEAVNIMVNKVGDEILIRGNCDQMAFSLAMLSYGMTEFLTDLLDEDKEEKILELIDRAYYVHLEMHKCMHEAGAHLTSFGDSSCGPDLISREMFLKYSMPFHQRLKRDLGQLGISAICHICGKLDIIMEDVASIGYPGVEIDYKSDITMAKKLLDGKSVMFGPIDPSGVFYYGNTSEMIEETQKVLEIFGGRGLVIGSGCALPAGVPEENIKAFVETVKNQ